MDRLPERKPSDGGSEEESSRERLSLDYLRSGYIVDKNAAAPTSSGWGTASEEFKHYAPALIKTALLFTPPNGKVGVAATIGTGAVYGLSELDSNAGILENFGRGALGVGKGLGTRYMINKVGALEGMTVATRGLTIGVLGRAIDIGGTPDAYFDRDGKFSPASVATRIVGGALDQKALGIDLLLTGVAHAPEGLGGRLGNAIRKDPLVRNMTMGGAMGLASGALSEMDRQTNNNQSLNVQQIFLRGALQSGIDAVAAAPGGLYSRRLATSLSTSSIFEGKASAPSLKSGGTRSGYETVDLLKAEPVRDALPSRGSASEGLASEGLALRVPAVARSLSADHTDPGARQFILVGGDVDIAGLLGRARTASLVHVREMLAGGLGATKPLLIGHNENGSIAPVARELGLGSQIASCNPLSLELDLRQRHILANTPGDVYLGFEPGNGRLTFASSLSLLPHDAPFKLALGAEKFQPPWHSVSALLRDPLFVRDLEVHNRVYTPVFEPKRVMRWAHELSDIKEFVPECGMHAGRPYGYFLGGEQIVIPLMPLRSGDAHGPVLKLSTLDFRKSWGYRKFPMGIKDAEVIEGPYRMSMPDGEFNHWYVQERAESVSYHDKWMIDDFHDALKSRGKYCFWDQKVGQFGYKLRRDGSLQLDKHGDPEIVLLDYNAITRLDSYSLQPNRPRSSNRPQQPRGH